MIRREHGRPARRPPRPHGDLRKRAPPRPRTAHAVGGRAGDRLRARLSAYTPMGYNLGMESLSRTALAATLHCLTGCAIGEVLGMVISTWLGFSDAASIAV